MTVKNQVTSVALVMAVIALAVPGSAQGPRFATVRDDLSPLVLGNHKDCCDPAVPEDSVWRRPRLPVPPQYQKHETIHQRQPTPAELGPHHGTHSHHAADAPVSLPPIPPTSAVAEGAAPLRNRESEFSQPADVGSLFSDERTQRLSRLSTLLEELSNRLDQQAVSFGSDDTHPSDASTKPSNDKALPQPFPSMNRTEISELNGPPPSHLTPPREPATPDAAIPDAANPEPDAREPDVQESDHGESAGSASEQPYVTDLPPVPPFGPTEPVSVTVPQNTAQENTSPQDTEPPSITGEPSPATTDPVSQDALNWIQQTAVDAPVDRLALADNLYAADETVTALKVYSEIDAETLSEDDRHWYEMQLAGCHRRLGDINEAAKHYRTLVTIENPAWMADMARWWLMVLDSRESMTRQSAELEVFIQQLKEQVHDETQP